MWSGLGVVVILAAVIMAGWTPERTVAVLMACTCVVVLVAAFQTARYEMTRPGVSPTRFDAYRSVIVFMLWMACSSCMAVARPDLFLTPGPRRWLFIGEFYWMGVVVVFGYFCAMRRTESYGQHPLQQPRPPASPPKVKPGPSTPTHPHPRRKR